MGDYSYINSLENSLAVAMSQRNAAEQRCSELELERDHLRLLLDDAERQLGALRQERDDLLNRLGGFDD